MAYVNRPLGWILLFSGILGLSALSSLFIGPRLVYAAPATPLPPPPGPDRFTNVDIEVTLHEWWLIGWADSQVYCSFYADHEGLPNGNDVYSACGEDIYIEWLAYSLPCYQQDVSTCIGYYMQEVSTKKENRTVPVKLPEPEIWVSLENCNPDPDGWCSTQPNLVLTAEEPLPNETITSIHGLAGADPYTCDGDRCMFKLNATSDEGVRLQFWAYSTYGDSSEPYEALIRVVSDKNADRLVERWYVDIISDQWTGKPIASCAAAWESFPPPGPLPQWLTTPDNPENLTSRIPYTYLAGKLIAQGEVDVSACADSGLLENGSASPCGVEASRQIVEAWQNQFNKLILQNARDRAVPAQLLKNLFSRESQFWPGAEKRGQDVGLGQLTENGADTALLWNPLFYDQFCPLVYDEGTCQGSGFANLDESQQDFLRRALVGSVDATCAECPLGIDLEKAAFSVSIFGRTLLANCEQTGKIVENVSGQKPGNVVSYEDLWKLTLVNYNAGPGCLSTAVEQAALTSGGVIDWNGVSTALDAACPGASSYVNDISIPVQTTEITATETPPAEMVPVETPASP